MVEAERGRCGMTLGERIQALRRAAGLSQEALGERLGVTRQSISKWESDLSTPELEKLMALSALFGVSLDELMGKTPAREIGDAPPPGAPPHRRWLWVLAGVLLLVLLVALPTWPWWMPPRMTYHPVEIVSEELWRDARELDDFSGELLYVEFDSGTATLALSARPGPEWAGQQVAFGVDSDGKARSFPAENRGGVRWDALVTVPLDDAIQVSVLLGEGEEQKTCPALSWTGVVSFYEPNLIMNFYGDCTADQETGEVRLQGVLSFDLQTKKGGRLPDWGYDAPNVAGVEIMNAEGWTQRPMEWEGSFTGGLPYELPIDETWTVEPGKSASLRGYVAWAWPNRFMDQMAPAVNVWRDRDGVFTITRFRDGMAT